VIDFLKITQRISVHVSCFFCARGKKHFCRHLIDRNTLKTKVAGGKECAYFKFITSFAMEMQKGVVDMASESCQI